ncbi:acyl-CoA dehydrogenase family protein [Frankia sp. R82]|uniref:acyl-CoA dehydrogenase family protein n=1 Tax=Frankia sp. R82 TaxID=2950553 RepID=UPI00204364B3|nr:acyl-CoA dehydrogenase family protein [Frankia sp. R82]MCM3882045.1 acyl-CoA dehydrogenase [Frankia sp. R82]
MDAAERDLLGQSLRKIMTSTAAGPALDGELTDLGWPELLAELPEVAVPLVFGLLGETGTVASVLNDVILAAAGQDIGGTTTLPYAGGSWLVWDRDVEPPAEAGAESSGPTGAFAVLDPALPLRRVEAGEPLVESALAAGRRALGWWLVGSGRAMLALAREHALARAQFGRPIASFQAVRHKLAETLVALEGAEATLLLASDDFSSLLAKAAAGQAALTAAKHCQQVLAGIGYTTEHALHHHIERVLVLDGLLGSSKQLTKQIGATLRRDQVAPRYAHL